MDQAYEDTHSVADTTSFRVVEAYSDKLFVVFL